MPLELREVATLWSVSVVCSSFHCLPDAARRALDDDVGGSIAKILDMRGFEDAKQRWESAPAKHPPTDPQAMRYMKIMMGLVGNELGVKTE